MQLNATLLTGALLFLSIQVEAGAVSSDELTLRRDWVAARFEGRQPPPRTDPALVVLANHGPVLKNARAGKPLCLAGENHTRGLLCHAPSQIRIRQPVKVDLGGATEFFIRGDETSDGFGWDHADWVEAKVTLRDGRTVWLDDLPVREVADHVHQKGARFVVWFEPECVVDGSWLEKNHPGWILRGGDSRLVNLGNTNAWDWILERIDGMKMNTNQRIAGTTAAVRPPRVSP